MELLAAVVASVFGGGAIGAIVNNLLTRRKTKADAAVSTVEAASKIVDLYDKALKDLQLRVDQLQERVQSLEAVLATKDLEIAMLKSQLGAK